MIQSAFAPGAPSVNFGHGGLGRYSFLSDPGRELRGDHPPACAQTRANALHRQRLPRCVRYRASLRTASVHLVHPAADCFGHQILHRRHCAATRRGRASSTTMRSQAFCRLPRWRTRVLESRAPTAGPESPSLTLVMLRRHAPASSARCAGFSNPSSTPCSLAAESKAAHHQPHQHSRGNAPGPARDLTTGEMEDEVLQTIGVAWGAASEPEPGRAGTVIYPGSREGLGTAKWRVHRRRPHGREPSQPYRYAAP